MCFIYSGVAEEAFTAATALSLRVLMKSVESNELLISENESRSSVVSLSSLS